ncbi:MAG: hypothetical protein ABSE73_18115 [Planctomycetota bacterium]
MLRTSCIGLFCVLWLAACGNAPPQPEKRITPPRAAETKPAAPDANAAQPVLPAIKPGPAAKDTKENVAAWASRNEALWDKKAKGRYDSDYPDGTIKHTARMGVSGWPELAHEDFVIPAGAKAERRWDYSAVPLPGGATLMGNSLGCTGGNKDYEPWSFLHVNGRAPGGKKTEDLLKPAFCVAANTSKGEGWASAELMFERPMSAECLMKFSLRIKRVAGDPALYLLISCDAAGGTLENVSLSGFPNTTHPIFYGLCPQWPAHAPFLERQRWIWLAGRDWNMHDNKEKHEAELAAGDPGGVFWYNRENSETGGMTTVFLPEEVSKTSAAGTYGVGVNLGLKGTALRLALSTWSDWRGWEAVREQFIRELPERVKRLREMSFTWPIDDALPAALRKQAETLAAAEFLPPEGRAQLRQVLSQYHAALDALHAQPIPAAGGGQGEARFAKERAVLGLAAKVEDAVKPLLKQWVDKGGGATGAPAGGK